MGLLAFLFAAAAFAWDTPPPQPTSIQELREQEYRLHERRSRALEEIQSKLESQRLDAGTAIMERQRINTEYQRELDALRLQQERAYRDIQAEEIRAKDKRPGSRSLGGRRIEIPATITYPQGPDAAPIDEKPHKEGRQKNAGFGVRELEF